MFDNLLSQNSDDLVTVIIPVYNGERFINESIQSILGQTYSNIELIIVDDGSTDNTDKVIRQYLDVELSSIKISYLKQVNQGKAAAVNNALRHSKGVFIAILDHDDIYPNNSIERRVFILKSNPLAIAVYGDAFLMNEKSFIYGKKKSRQIKHIEDLIGFLKNPIASCTIMFRRNVMDKIGKFDENIQRLDDVDRNITLFLAGPLIYVPEAFWQFRTYKRKIFISLRIRTIVDFYIIVHKYLSGFARLYIFSKQLCYQLVKVQWECITWRK